MLLYHYNLILSTLFIFCFLPQRWLPKRVVFVTAGSRKGWQNFGKMWSIRQNQIRGTPRWDAFRALLPFGRQGVFCRWYIFLVWCEAVGERWNKDSFRWYACCRLFPKPFWWCKDLNLYKLHFIKLLREKFRWWVEVIRSSFSRPFLGEGGEVEKV